MCTACHKDYYEIYSFLGYRVIFYPHGFNYIPEGQDPMFSPVYKFAVYAPDQSFSDNPHGGYWFDPGHAIEECKTLACMEN